MAVTMTVPASERTPGKSRALPSALWPWLLLLPAFISLASVSFYPIFNGLYLSFTNRSLITQDNDFIGIANYVQLLADPPFWNAWWHTIWFTVISTGLETFIGLAMALILCETFAGRGMIRAAMLVPWAMPTVVTSKMFGWLFDGQHGIINFILLHAGLIDQNVNWYGSPDTALTTIILADVWKTTPFMALLLLAGLSLVPDELLRAAKVDGATAWQRFIRVIVPVMKPAILVALLFRTLDAFRIFDNIYILTQGSQNTRSVSILNYDQLFTALNLGVGSAMSVLIFIAVALIAFAFIKGFGAAAPGQDLR